MLGEEVLCAHNCSEFCDIDVTVLSCLSVILTIQLCAGGVAYEMCVYVGHGECLSVWNGVWLCVYKEGGGRGREVHIYLLASLVTRMILYGSLI